MSEAGSLLIGDTPALVIAERAVWRVPVLLTSPSRGVIGTVGAVDVDAQIGEVLADKALGRQILERVVVIRPKDRMQPGPTPAGSYP